jgi:hypothetical protein
MVNVEQCTEMNIDMMRDVMENRMVASAFGTRFMEVVKIISFLLECKNELKLKIPVLKDSLFSKISVYN